MPSALTTALPFLLLVLLRALLVFSMTVRPSPFRWMFFVPIAGIAYYIIFHNTKIGPAGYYISCTAAADVFSASDYLLLTDVQRELFLVGQQTPISESSFASRLKWALKLFISNRGVGWTHEFKSVIRPHPPPMSKTTFVASRLLWMAYYVLLFDITEIHTDNNPFFTGEQSMAAGGWLWRFANTVASGVRATCQISQPYCFFSIVSVILGLSRPQDWPPLFGFWRDAYTLRRFWGYDLSPINPRLLIVLSFAC
jgi:hypothetical protein